MSGRRHSAQAALALVLSFSFHGVTMAVLSGVEEGPQAPPEPAMEFFEVAASEPEAEPEPLVEAAPEPEPDPEVVAQPEPQPQPQTRPRRRRETAPRRAAAEAPEVDEAPAPGLVAEADLAVDLTGFRLSSAQVGNVGATGTGPSRAGPASPSTSAQPGSASGPSRPRFTPAASLTRPPVPPSQAGIVRCLERNYPRQARQQGLAGSARVRLNIAPSGTPGGLRVTSESVPGQGFGEACVSCLEGNAWTAPLGPGGQPVSTRTLYTCRFSVR